MDQLIADFTEKIRHYGREEQERILSALSWGQPPQGNTGPKAGPAPVVPARPLGAASILAELNLDADALIAALLQEALERNSAELPAIEERFGPEVALMVRGVTRIAALSAKSKTVQEAENIRKMLFAMVEDIRVIFIKLADKLHTLRTLGEIRPEQRKAAAQECLDIYAPLADRLGISWIKAELEDLSLKHLNREIFAQIKEIVALKKEERTRYLDTIRETILREAASAGIAIEVESRAKHFYSIYQKMRKRNKGTDDLYDLFGIRVLCDSIENCYTLLGLVHRLWKPLEGRFKDYIAMPKSNGYQSLHTTVMAVAGPEDSGEKSLEIQIRTWEMHHIAEYGIASHWLYKKGSTNELIRPGDLSIVNRLKDWKLAEGEGAEGGGGSSESFLEDIKREILRDSIYVFTPQGKVIELPSGATPLDFAYHIHTAIGEHCVGAKADGSIVPLASELQNTQVVEILTSPNAHPHVNWLRAVRTSKARSKIRSWLQQNDDSIIIEKNVVAKKKKAEISPPPEHPPAEAPAASGGTRVIQQIQDPAILQVRVEDEKNMMIRFARCCRPVTGDPIVGYVSRGRGIIVHRRNCSNLANIPDFAERKIETEWENAQSILVRRFKIEARKSENLFSEIEGAIRKYQGHLLEGRLEETGTNHFTAFFTMQLEQPGDLKGVLKNIKGIPAIFSIQTLTEGGA
ncbi:MAG: RelA/SpoT family protein [Spirochaetaceae bacterium]|jgi:GTP pyrophosphokinase|nr:RelA/SpoT family protein [Spirochaetaceae bacterium]